MENWKQVVARRVSGQEAAGAEQEKKNKLRDAEHSKSIHAAQLREKNEAVETHKNRLCVLLLSCESLHNNFSV